MRRPDFEDHTHTHMNTHTHTIPPPFLTARDTVTRAQHQGVGGAAPLDAGIRPNTAPCTSDRMRPFSFFLLSLIECPVPGHRGTGFWPCDWANRLMQNTEYPLVRAVASAHEQAGRAGGRAGETTHVWVVLCLGICLFVCVLSVCYWMMIAIVSLLCDGQAKYPV